MSANVNGRLINTDDRNPWGKRESTNIEEIYNFLPNYGQTMTDRHHHYQIYDINDTNVCVHVNNVGYVGVRMVAGITRCLAVNQGSAVAALIPLTLIQDDISEAVTDYDTNGLQAGDYTWSSNWWGNGILGTLKITALNGIGVRDTYRIRLYDDAEAG